MKDRTSILYWAARNEIPIFVPAIFDGAFGSQLWQFWQDHRQFRVDRIGSKVNMMERVLDVQLTASLLRDVPPVYRTQINDVLLAALIEAFHHWSGRRRLLIDLEGHGREQLFSELDVTRTVGWFTSLYPVLLEQPDSAGAGELLRSVKEQLRRIPRQGIGYGQRRYLGPDEMRQSLSQVPRANVSFNYFGQLDRGLTDQTDLFAAAHEEKGPERAVEAEWNLP